MTINLLYKNAGAVFCNVFSYLLSSYMLSWERLDLKVQGLGVWAVGAISIMYMTNNSTMMDRKSTSF